MRTKIKQVMHSSLFKETAVYALTNALFTGLPLILMPFLVAIMSPEDYGIVDLFKSIGLVLTPILGLSTVQSVTRFYYDMEEDRFKAFCSSIVVFHIFMALVGVCIVGCCAFFLDGKYLLISFLAVLFFLFNQVTEILLSIYRVKHNTKWYVLIRLGSVVLDLLLLTLFYFWYTHYNWSYRVIPNVLSTIVVGLIGLLLLIKQFGITFKFNKKLLMQALAYSTPLIMHMIAGYILNVGDRFLILHFLGEKDLGNYSVAYQLGMSISFFYTSFNLAWIPTFFEWMKVGKHRAINRVKKLVFAGLIIMGTLLMVAWVLLSKYIPNLQQYDVSLNLVIVIILSYLVLSFYRFNSNYFFYYKNTGTLAKITAGTAVFSIGLNVVLIPRYGILGAGITTLVTFVIMLVLVEIFKKKSNFTDGTKMD